MKFILGRKLGMTRVFDDEGRHVAVTKIEALPCEVSQMKTKEKDGYKAVQVKAINEVKGDFRHSSGRSEQQSKSESHIKRGEERKAKVIKIAEFRDEQGRYKVGQKITLKNFKKDEIVTVEGTSKGKGFAGTIKRHGFSRGPETHGSNNVREPGSIGGGYPQRVIKGRHMAGKMGAETATVKNLRIVDIDDNILLIAGAVPGPNKSIIKVFGSGEIAEEEVDTAALEERQAMEKMLEEQKEEKEETKAEEKVEAAETAAE